MITRFVFAMGFTLLIGATPAFLCSANDAAEEELAELRARYDDAATRALEPLRKRHIEALESFVRRATRSGDLDAAVKGKAELDRFRAEAGMMDNPFIGQWEYRHANRTYRRIVLENGKVELWREGKVWLKPDGKPWWDGHSWKRIGKRMELRRPDGGVEAIWEFGDENDPGTVTQREPDTSNKVMLRWAATPWTR